MIRAKAPFAPGRLALHAIAVLFAAAVSVTAFQSIPTLRSHYRSPSISRSAFTPSQLSRAACRRRIAGGLQMGKDDSKAISDLKTPEGKKENKAAVEGEFFEEPPAAELSRGAIPSKNWLGVKREGVRDIPVTFDDVCKAAYKIKDAVVYTSTKRNSGLSTITGTELYLKSEYKQYTGSFKERGARNALMQLPEAQKKKGVIAASAGNHALALCYHGGLLGIPVTVIMPTIAPLTKVEKCRQLGANVVLYGKHILEAKEHALEDERYAGLQYINGYDDPAIVAGAGSIGLEILEQVPDVDVVVVPVGGAGLIAGVALAIKSLRPEVQIIGVETETCASFSAALKAGKPSPAVTTPTLADGLAVPTVGPHSFEVAKHFVDKCVLVSEKQVAISILRLLEHEKAVIEGGGAVGVAALLPGGPLDIPELKGKKIVTPLCGGNIDITVLGRVIERGLAADRRLVRFAVTVSDRPGGLAAMVSTISGAGASVWDITHERAWMHTSVDQVVNTVVCEVTGPEHEQKLKKALSDAGYPLLWDLGNTLPGFDKAPARFEGYRA
mmetsp:Transcript_12128/g.28567  ORF Transcript_12128/g.28567 Transcript_12128/m.28567 type:complete len:555 (+) Transcript_12128:199-1863(+)|eukprot:CAMPEP_0177713286 /NCGR_PEP_ID=MMETSP0484_2-20121128/12857_1 /TAXON_ID=354590 /ORGANISM="Rhodomonas lens, Strain RHODO" /LENGTH=554 /DNA_ID=CAMNT_0019225163 /DNA_START=165 /DNA_END=1829 /DNA_ORIENTATION=-